VERMTDKELLINMRAIIDELLKLTVPISFDSERLFETSKEINHRLKDENLFDPMPINTCRCGHLSPCSPCLNYGANNYWYVKCRSCGKAAGLHATKREAVIAWNKKNEP
jgi:valyl-tRNA synthetase